MAVEDISMESVPVAMPDQATTRPPETPPEPEPEREVITDETVGRSVDVTA